MNEDFQRLLDEHPEWSKSVRAQIAALGQQASSLPPATVVHLPVRDQPPDVTPAPAPAAAPIKPPSEPEPAARDEEPPPAPEPWITTSAFARQLGVTNRTIRRWIKQGMPCGGPPGATVRVRVSECRAWLLSRGKSHRLLAERLRATPSQPASAAPPVKRGREQPSKRRSQACERPSRAVEAADEGDGGDETAGGAAEPERGSVAPVEPWVDVATIAKHIACSEAHVRALARRTDHRRIPHRREGRRLLFKKTLVDKWLDRNGGEVAELLARWREPRAPLSHGKTPGQRKPWNRPV